MGTELIMRIIAPWFVAGIVWQKDKIIACAPILNYMWHKNWTIASARSYFESRGFIVELMEVKSG